MFGCHSTTGRFIRFSVITNIYNKNTKEPTLMELFIATGKLIFFSQLEIFDVRITGDTAHIDMILKFLIHTHTHTHTHVNMGAFCLHRHPVSVNCLYHARMVLSVGGSFAYFAPTARCTVTTDLLCDIPTHKTTSPPERPFSHYIHSCRLAAEI